MLSESTLHSPEVQCCQLSRIIQEIPDFGGYLPVSRFEYEISWAQLFEGRLVLNPGLNLTRVSFSLVQKHFLGQFSLIFIEYQIINLLTKRTKLNLLYKLSYLDSNFALTLGYLNPALNNPALKFAISLVDSTFRL